jgi:hypothetical protein
VHRYIENDLKEEIKNEVHQLIKKTFYEEIKTDFHHKTGGKQMIQVVGNINCKYDADVNETVAGDHAEKITGKFGLKAMEIALEAVSAISLKVGGSCVVVDMSGVTVKGSGTVAVTAPMVNINSGGGSAPKTPKAPAAATVTAPSAYTAAMEPTTTDTKVYSGSEVTPPHYTASKGYKTPTQMAQSAGTGGAHAQSGAQGEQATTTQEEQQQQEQQKHFIEIELKDEDQLPVSGEYFEVVTPEGTLASGTTDEKGYARIDGMESGNATVRFPHRDKTVLES